MPDWLLLGNCQVYGLANCLTSLARDLVVEPVDEATYERGADGLHKRLGKFDRIIGLDALLERLPTDNLDPATVARLPIVAFSAFHPDLCYLAAAGPLTRGPLGHYQSAIAYVAYSLGYDVSRTVALYSRDTYERLGYLARWDASRDWLLEEFSSKGHDASRQFVAWSRRGPFMHTSNHPRIDVLMDVARMLLEQAGVEIVEPGILPVDNLLAGPVFPVYPEIAAHLGIKGSYRFKPGGSYQMLDLEKFVARSFEHYRAAAHLLPEHPAYLGMLSAVVAYLSGWGGTAGRICPDGGKATYRGLFGFDFKRRGDFPAGFVFGMHGAGSSFLHSMVQQICAVAKIPSLNIPDRMFTHGLRDEWPCNPEVLDLLEDGRVLYGFRELAPILTDAGAGLATRRSVLLVQDPRDALVSRHALTGGKRMPPHWNDATPAGDAAVDEYIKQVDDYVLAEADGLLRRMRDYVEALGAGSTMVRRYEDVHQDQVAFARAVFDHLGITVPPAALQQVATAMDAIRGVGPYAPGIHARMLRADTIETLNHTFREIAGLYGYNLDSTGFSPGALRGH